MKTEDKVEKFHLALTSDTSEGEERGKKESAAASESLHSRPQSPFRFSQPAEPWYEKRRALETKDFQSFDSRTSGIHVCCRDVSIYCIKEPSRFYFRSRFPCFKQPIKKIRIISKVPCSSPSILVRRPRRLREAKRAMETRMGSLL